MGFLIDTCVWIDVEQGELAPADVADVTGDEPVFMSPITMAELRFGAELARTPDIRQHRFAALERLALKPMLVIDGRTGALFGLLAAQIRAAGRGHRHRVQDLWLASQAIQHNHRLLTRNVGGFRDVPGLDLITI